MSPLAAAEVGLQVTRERTAAELRMRSASRRPYVRGMDAACDMCAPWKSLNGC